MFESEEFYGNLLTTLEMSRLGWQSILVGGSTNLPAGTDLSFSDGYIQDDSGKYQAELCHYLSSIPVFLIHLFDCPVAYSAAG